jgi:hypothetical protein
MGWEGIHLFEVTLQASRLGFWELPARSPDVTLMICVCFLWPSALAEFDCEERRHRRSPRGASSRAACPTWRAHTLHDLIALRASAATAGRALPDC